jgi:3',5'-cyclic AMP phosphodiesterase CpdA
MVRQLILIDDRAEQADEIEGFLRTWGLEYTVISNRHLLKPTENTNAAREEFCHEIVSFIRSSLTSSTQAILLDVLFQQGTEREEPLGYRLGKLLRTNFPEVPIILFTVRSDVEDVTDATASFNFDGYIPKGTFTSWRNSDHFIAALSKARLRRDEVLDEFRALRELEADKGKVAFKPTNPVILHISDIHYGIALSSSDRRRSYGNTLDALRRDIVENYPKDGIPTPNVIVVSGDITTKGQIVGYPLAKEFLLNLAAAISRDIEPNRIIMAPGNHDVSRVLSRLGCGLDPYTETIDDEGKPDYFYPFRFAPFKAFFDDFYYDSKVYRLETHKMFSVFDLAHPFGIVIVSLNSCEQLDHSAKRRNVAHISMDTIENLKTELKLLGIGPETPKIAVWHHPLLFEDPTDPSHHRLILNELAKQGFKLYLHGHIHKPYSDFKPNAYEAHGVYEFGAGSIGAEAEDRPADWPKHYEVLAFDNEKGTCIVYSRQRVGSGWMKFASFDGGAFTYEFRFKPAITDANPIA